MRYKIMFDKKYLSILKVPILLLSAGLYGCTFQPPSFPILSGSSSSSQKSEAKVYRYLPPTALPKRKPTPPPRPQTFEQGTGTVAGNEIPALFPNRIPLPKRNPRRGNTKVQALNNSDNKTATNSGLQTISTSKNGASDNATFRYKVMRGDSVYSISRDKRVSIRELIILNKLSAPYKLVAGQVIQLPVSKEHVVAGGDTIYGISRRYGVETTELVRINKIQPPYSLRVGQRLNLPALRKSTVSSAAVTKKAVRSTIKKQTVSAPSTQDSAVNRVPEAKNFTGPVPKPLPRSASNFLRPVNGKIISTFGPKPGGIHNDGMNIEAKKGTTVKAAENGVVVYAGSELKGFGQMLLVKHSDGWVTAYAHTDQLLVGRGQRVKRGQAIAKVGSTGNVSKPQLHFEIRKGSEAVNPAKLITK
ncbi:peptidoglycan DD-metalloendopeptidase family protein [Kiloniella antarctica]|uniref:Peptidoglycan DD-metalloendopeptidase family protein n=1 Tax=Kiloniella antarctica TaxID=1550907 RepID=A0ABW5BPH1_9PROT